MYRTKKTKQRILQNITITTEASPSISQAYIIHLYVYCYWSIHLVEHISLILALGRVHENILGIIGITYTTHANTHERHRYYALWQRYYVGRGMP